MKALVPHRFETADVLADDDVNKNLRAIASDIARSQGRRYTYCSVVIPIDGVADTDTAAERTVPLPMADDGVSDAYPIDVVGMELSVFSATGATWTATATDENGRTVVLSTTTAGATVEAYDSSNVPLQVSSSFDLQFVLAGSAANTITRGTLTLHLRMDRHQQNSGTLTTFTPALVGASTSTAGATLDTELTNAQAAVTDDTAANLDLRCMCFMANDLAAAQIWRLPSGAGTALISAVIYGVGTAARSVAIDTTFAEGTTSTSVATLGTSSRVYTLAAYAGTRPNDPTDTADDVVVTLTPTGGTISRVFGFLWFS